MESQANRDEDLFRPPFSPEPKCLHHERSLGWRHARDGIHRRRAEPTRVQRYRLAERQKKNRERLEAAHGRPEPQATRDQVETLLRRVTGGPCSFKLVSDEHRAYVQAAKRMKGWTIEHERISSKAPRTHRNPLWPANLADLLVRHGGANHERETIAFSKRVQNALLRMAIFQVDRNFPSRVRLTEDLREV